MLKPPLIPSSCIEFLFYSLLHASRTGASISSLLLPAALAKCFDRCKFHLFIPIIRSDYMGTFARNNDASLQVRVSVLKKLSMSFHNPSSGAWVTMHPDEVFAAYIF